jgi:hypothetical protein
MQDKLDLSDFDPRCQPKHIQVFLLIFPVIFLLWGIVDALSDWYPGKLLLSLFVALFAGAAFDGAFLLLNAVFAQSVNQGQQKKSDAVYVMQGVCTEITEQLRRILPAPTERDKTLRYYLLVRLGQHEEAKQQYADITLGVLTPREKAMLKTARLMQYMMTGNWFRTEQFFLEEQVMLDETYAAQPDFSETFRPYEDDTLDYYLLSAAYYAILGQDENAYACRQKAEERVAVRPSPEAQFFDSLMELHQIYAAGSVHTADAVAHDLSYKAAGLTSPATPGARADLQRYLTDAAHIGELRLAAEALNAPGRRRGVVPNVNAE